MSLENRTHESKTIEKTIAVLVQNTKDNQTVDILKMNKQLKLKEQLRLKEQLKLKKWQLKLKLIEWKILKMRAELERKVTERSKCAISEERDDIEDDNQNKDFEPDWGDDE